MQVRPAFFTQPCHDDLLADFINTHPKRMEGTFCPAQAADLFLGLVFVMLPRGSPKQGS